jgi:hypothetical protein
MKKIKVRIANPVPGHSAITSLKNAQRYVARGMAKFDERNQLVFIHAVEPTAQARADIRVRFRVGDGSELRQRQSEERAQQDTFRRCDEAQAKFGIGCRWHGRTSGGVKVMQAEQGHPDVFRFMRDMSRGKIPVKTAMDMTLKQYQDKRTEELAANKAAAKRAAR